ncbi:MAG: NAD(P)/FAD-dependent oxidoreductase [Acidimicrobiales bacterium]
MRPRAVIVGASLAGLRAAEALREGGHDGPLTIVGAERHLPYDRPPLSKQVLTGKAEAGDVALCLDDHLGAEWLLGRAASGLDLATKQVLLAGPEAAPRPGLPTGISRPPGAGSHLPFDLLVIATGAHPRTLPGFDAGDGVHYLRTLDDALELRLGLERAAEVVVIGGGFIGLEVASSAHARGARATVLEALPVPLQRTVGATVGAAITGLHERRGVDVRTGVSVAALLRAGRKPNWRVPSRAGVGTPAGAETGDSGHGQVEGVLLADGTVVAADLVVVGVGVSPATGWLDGSGVDLADGVVCDQSLRVMAGGHPVAGVVAAGDVARWPHPGYREAVRIEHWTNAAEQGAVAARSLLEGDRAPAYAPTPYFWSDQHGLKIQMVGHPLPGDDVAVIEGTLGEDRFVVAYGRAGRLVAALGVRRPAMVMALQQMIASGAAFPPAIDSPKAHPGAKPASPAPPPAPGAGSAAGA